MDSIEQVTIVGTGLLGGSIGLALRAAGWSGRIVGVGRRAETLGRAQQRGCIDAGTTDLPAALEDTHLLILATPLGRFRDLLQQVAAHDHDRLIMTDVGSVKQAVCDDAAALLPDPSRFVGAHPMAGSEQQGPDHASADLFRDKPCILTPIDTQANDDAQHAVRSLWAMLGMRLVEQHAAEHDQQMAVISHLPHALAVLLVESAQQANALDVASTGFGDTTRIASGDPTIWEDIFKLNAPAVVNAIDAYINDLQQFKRAVADGNDQAIADLLQRAKATRDAWKDAAR